MKKLIIISLILFCLTNSNAEEKSKEWSEYQGKMNWKDAGIKCANIGMRLPTRNELRKAFAANETELWGKDGIQYWTSDVYSHSNADAFTFFVDNGGIGFFNKKYGDNVHVRCIR